MITALEGSLFVWLVDVGLPSHTSHSPFVNVRAHKFWTEPTKQMCDPASKCTQHFSQWEAKKGCTPRSCIVQLEAKTASHGKPYNVNPGSINPDGRWGVAPNFCFDDTENLLQL